MKLKSIEIKGFKSFKSLGLRLFKLNILIGPNGSGKSNFISFFKLLNQIIERKLQLFIGQSGGADSLLRYGRKSTEEIYFKLRFGDNSYYAKLVPTLKNSLIFSEEHCSFKYEFMQPPKKYEIELGKGGHEETGLFDEEKDHPGKIAFHVIDYLKVCKVYHFHDTSDSSKMKQMCDINDNEILKPDASNLAAYLFMLKEKHPKHFSNIVDSIKRIMPSFDNFNLKPSKLNDNKISLEWSERNTDSYFDAHSLSDGTLRFICLATLLLQPELPSTILLDEPELGLHPSAITLLSGLLKSASQKAQVICSTQSVTLVNKFEPKDILVVDRDNEGSVFRRLDTNELQQWLEDYELGDLWEKNVLGGTP